MMTKQDKINWMKSADTEQLLEQFRFAVIRTDNAMTIADQISAEEDYELARNEIAKRLNRASEPERTWQVEFNFIDIRGERTPMEIMGGFKTEEEAIDWASENTEDGEVTWMERIW